MKNKKPAKIAEIVFYAFILALALIIINQPHLLTDSIKTAAGGHYLKKEYSWYIIPEKNGQRPRPNDQAGFIEDYNVYFMGGSSEKAIYLTFDAGYENGYTSSMLDSLKKHNVQAAFFIVGSYIKRNPELVVRMVNEGHLVCNHSMNHKNMAKITDYNEFKYEVTSVEDAFKELTGKDMPKYFRPPEGIFSEQSLKYTEDLGYTTVFWSFAYVDWYNDKQPSKDEAMKKIIGRTHNGEIALLHATSKTNSEILTSVLEKWKEMGYTLKSLDEFKK